MRAQARTGGAPANALISVGPSVRAVDESGRDLWESPAKRIMEHGNERSSEFPADDVPLRPNASERQEQEREAEDGLIASSSSSPDRRLGLSLSRLDMHVDGITDGFPTTRSTHCALDGASTGDDGAAGAAIRSSNIVAGATPKVYAHSRSPVGNNSRSGSGHTPMTSHDHEHQDVTQGSLQGTHRPKEGPVTSPDTRKVLADAGADQPLPHFPRSEAEALDAAIEEFVLVHGVEALSLGTGTPASTTPTDGSGGTAVSDASGLL